MITLYDYELSGNCYKLRLLMNFLKIQYKRVAVEFYPGQEHKSDWFLKLNPLGQLPVIDDEGFVLRDAQAILVYLASRYDPHDLWYPRSAPILLGEIGQWLAFADGITTTASAARLHDGLFYDIDVAAARPAPTVCSVFSTSISGSASTSAATGFAAPPIRRSPISPVFPTSCCPTKAVSHARITLPFAAGAIDLSGSVVSSSCRASSRPGRPWPIRQDADRTLAFKMMLSHAV